MIIGTSTASGDISGTPTAAGTYKVVVTATTSGSPARHASVTSTILIVLPPPPAVGVVPPPAVGTVAAPYSFAFSVASNGLAPFTWSETGSLPPGLAFSGTGALSGKPTALGSFPITVTVQDATGQTSPPQNFTIQILGTDFTHGFTSTGSMATARDWHTATLLKNGTVLVTGGVNNSAFPTSSEIFDPARATFTATGSMGSVRVSATATLLNNGKVLLAGGKAADSFLGPPLATAELYDPASGTFTATGSMNTAHVYHTATLLSDGRVLVAGGLDANSNPIATAEIFDPSNGTFTPTGSMTIAGGFRTATLLNTGKVLVAGGFDFGGSAIATAELFDLSTGTFSATSSMSVARAGHTATLLPDGKVLVIGGAPVWTDHAASTAELFDPVAKGFTPAGTMAAARALHTATLLPDGRVLVAGGSSFFYGSSPVSLAEAELFDPTTASFVVTSKMTTARESQTATLLQTGVVLITGGANGTLGYSQTTVLSTAELFQ